jgi:hypothetical protein
MAAVTVEGDPGGAFGTGKTEASCFVIGAVGSIAEPPAVVGVVADDADDVV